MLRTSFALIAVSSVASAQGIVSPYVPPPFIPVPSTGPLVGMNGISGSMRIGGLRIGGYSSFASPYYFPSYGYGSSNLTYFGNGYGYGIPSYPLPAPTPFIPPPLPDLAPASVVNKDITEAEFTSRLELILPAAAEVWVDGNRVMGSAASDVSLTSPPLKVGASHTFKIRATWSVEGTKYQVERSVAVKAGEKSRLIIVSGDAVK